ncbi:MAG: hypothetical protein IPM74_03605 [Crocinitomicaceae bacterium]|nr:hypothetical protein [Crocinitomicaceae bacterium]MBK8924999.1 hypothetical protein [Crocinitomicaceae bacterium]
MEKNDYQEILKQLQKKQRNSGILYAFVPVTVISICLFVFWIRLEDRDRLLDEKTTALEQKEKELIDRENKINYLDSAVANKDAEIVQFNEELSGIQIKEPEPNTLIYQKIEQRNYADSTIESLKEIKSYNKKYRVNYYRQSSDGDKVINALTELGLHSKTDYNIFPSKIQHNLGPINSVKYGRNVDPTTCQLLVFQLIKEGFEIRLLDVFAKSTDENANTIVVYRNSKVLNQPALTTEEISLRFNE